MKTRSSDQILASNIKKFLADGHTQDSLHQRAGVGKATINRVLKGDVTSARLETVDKLANAIGVDPGDLISDLDMMVRSNGKGVLDKRLSAIDCQALREYVMQSIALAEQIFISLPKEILAMMATPTKETYSEFEKKLQELSSLLKSKEKNGN